MGLFGTKKQQPSLPEYGEIAIYKHVAQRIPDIGEFFIGWIGSPGADRVAPCAEELRGRSGWIPHRQARQFGIAKYQDGPLTFLTQMATWDEIALKVWAGFGLRRAEKREIEEVTSKILFEQGHGAAVTWVLMERPQDRLDPDFLAVQLQDA